MSRLRAAFTDSSIVRVRSTGLAATRALAAVVALGCAVGCGESSEEPRACGPDAAGAPRGLGALPAPSAEWSHASSGASQFNPRAADLDGDGLLEVLITGGSEQPAFGEMRVLDGATGALKWGAPTDYELYTSPVLLDVTGDGVLDVFVGGREMTLLALDGASGRELWRFQDTREEPEYHFYNFYTPLLVPDQTGDGREDLLLATGGADGIPPQENRPPGHLLVLSSSDGSLVAFAKLPDGRETYMSPILLPDDGAASPTLLFGTGGETWGGALWEAPLSAVLAGDLSTATSLVTGPKKGMIAPPSLADLDRDGRLDILLATFDGRLIALSGATRKVLWEKTFANTESYSTPVPGYFDGDDVPDVFAVFLHGAFPTYVSAERVLLSGKDGSVLWRSETGDFAMGSDVALDLDGDGIDEVIFLVNTLRDPLTARPMDQELHLIDSACHSSRKWGTAPSGLAAGSPWIGDLDGDKKLDLILPRHSTESDLDDSLITRFSIAAPVPERISWGGYFGTAFDSALKPRD